MDVKELKGQTIKIAPRNDLRNAPYLAYTGTISPPRRRAWRWLERWFRQKKPRVR